MIRLSSFGCQTSEHLLQRLATVLPKCVVMYAEFDNLDTCIDAIEEALDIQVFDCHVQQKATTQRLWEPDHDVDIVFRSTVQPKCRATVRVSPETYVEFIVDLESSGLWEYEGESPIGESS